MTTPVALLLSRLDQVKETARGKWQARCPAHDDKSPSLSIKETGDGTVLLKCWSGCTANEIVDGVDLELSDLFPRHEGFDHTQVPRSDEKPWNATDVLRALMHEIQIVAVCGGQVDNAGLSPEDAARFALAIQRLLAAEAAVRL
jgi:hypothetical protein